jgi:CCR4-NOT complex subunit CAF16
LIQGVTYLDSEWALNPIVRRDVPVSDLLASIGGNTFPERKKLLVDLLDVDEGWHMHAVSDGMCFSNKINVGERRRVQLAMGLMRPWTILLLDEVTVDLDVLVRSELLDFLRSETESRLCTIVYCTHIFDGLAGWPTHLLKMSVGRVMAFDSIPELELPQNGGNSALFEICLAWLKEDKAKRGRRGKENRKKWSELDESIRGPLMQSDNPTTHTRVERWRLMPKVE